jgi:outer membrane protein assembly factor BamB
VKTALMSWTFMLTVSVGCLAAQDWPQWRGPNRDNHLSGFAPPRTWPKELTKKWTVAVGTGESSPVMVGDRIYVFGREGGDEVTRCLDAATGKEVWNEKYATAVVKGAAAPFPGTRSTPAVGEGKICTLGVNGIVCCRDAVTGKLLWRKDEAKPQWYTSSSPLIVDGMCIVFAGGLRAFELAGGAEKWKWNGDKDTYGSPVLMTVDGVRQLVTPSKGMLAGVALADGKLLWQVPLRTDYFANYSTPLVSGSTVIYSESKGKGGARGFTGTMALKVVKKGDTFTATEIWTSPLVAAGYHTPLLKDNLIFGVDAERQFYCMDAKKGELRWAGKEEQGDCGCILDGGSVLVALSSDKLLTVFEPSAREYKEIARYKVGKDEPWSVPIIAGNRVYVKDSGKNDKIGSLTLLTIE